MYDYYQETSGLECDGCEELFEDWSLSPEGLCQDCEEKDRQGVLGLEKGVDYTEG